MMFGACPLLWLYICIICFRCWQIHVFFSSMKWMWPTVISYAFCFVCFWILIVMREWQEPGWRDDGQNVLAEPPPPLSAPVPAPHGLGKISEQKGILGPGPADLRFSEALWPVDHWMYAGQTPNRPMFGCKLKMLWRYEYVQQPYSLTWCILF